MESHELQSLDDDVDRQVLVLLQQHRRLTFLTLADSFPTHTWQSLFMALNRLCRQQHLELMPLAEDYEVVWCQGGGGTTPVSEGPSLRM